MNPKNLLQPARAPLGENESGAGGAGATLTQAKDAIKTTARDTAARIKSAAGETASRAKTEAERVATEKKDHAAERIGGYGSALHESAKSLERNDPNIAWATHRLAERIDGLADYVRTSDFSTLRRDAEGLARRHPVAFFGGLFLGGLVIGNLLKARPVGQSSDDDGSDWESADPTDFDAPSPSAPVPEI